MMSTIRKLQMTAGASAAAGRIRRGFTVIELMLSLVVLAIIVALGAPGLLSFVTQSRMTSQINEILADVSLARNEAASRGLRVAVCASNNSTTASPTCSNTVTDWASGRIVFVDVDGDGQRSTASGSTEILLKTAGPLTGGSTVTLSVPSMSPGPPSIQFRPYGGMAVSGSATLTGAATSTSLASSAVFTLCPNSTGVQGRALTIAMTGRPVISKVGC